MIIMQMKTLTVQLCIDKPQALILCINNIISVD